MKKLISLAGIAALVLGSTVAKADSVFIDSWDFSVSGVFTDYTMSSGTGSMYKKDKEVLTDSNGNTVTGYRDLSWGPNSYDSRSGLVISDTAAGTVYTDQAQASALTLTHRNNSINSSYATLESGSIYLNLTLTPLLEGADSLSFDTTLKFTFTETPNSGRYQDDYFVVTNVEASIDEFTYGGYTYYFSFFTSFDDLTQTDYAQFLNNGERWGWVTKEGKITTIPTYLMVTSTPIEIPPVPEPSTYAMLGLGLLMIGALVRRRATRS